MRTEAEIRQCIEWLNRYKCSMDIREPNYRFLFTAIGGQADILRWALGEATAWDKVHAAMVERFGPTTKTP